jgi:hypothetical protein
VPGVVSAGTARRGVRARRAGVGQVPISLLIPVAALRIEMDLRLPADQAARDQGSFCVRVRREGGAFLQVKVLPRQLGGSAS